MTEVYLCQRFTADKWVTVSASTYAPDTVESFEILEHHSPRKEPLRLVTLTLDNLDCLMVHARDMQIIRRA